MVSDELKKKSNSYLNYNVDLNFTFFNLLLKPILSVAINAI